RYHGDKRMYSVWDWSKNGTFRSNGQRLEQGFEYRFLAGEELIIGDEENVLKLG
ncbi:MAG TPA: FHA domain-containing protein, partial [Candidatus Choladousia intestinigallinarum]|nr:FHA domain-containing protein [Candidatus Choladousia intestinigallinarum]